jgi:uncharacterized protein YcfJ
MLNIKRKLLSAAMGLTLIAGPIGCASNAGNGALIGGAAGAGLGAIIGHNSHGRTGGGAAIGGAIGALTGGLIGNQMDEQERRDDYYDNYDRDRPVRYDRYDDYRDGPPPREGYTESRYYEDGNGRYYNSYRETRVYPGY